MADKKCVGITKGPGETSYEYRFVTPDRDQVVKTGEFVYYEVEVNGDRRKILGRVSKRLPLKLYPDSFMSDPDIPPSTIASVIGYDTSDYELFEVRARTLGYHDPNLDDFVNPRIPPRSGKPIYVADDELLTQVLSRKKQGEIGSAHIGSLLSRPEDKVPVVLDVKAFTSTHLAVIAGTGSGKSYLAGVLIEELLKPYNRACVLIIDPHGEYHTLSEMSSKEPFCSETYRPTVRVFRPEEVKVRISSLTMGDLRYLLPDLSEKMEFVLRRAFRTVQRRKKDKWALDDLLRPLREMAGQDEDGEEGDVEEVYAEDNGGKKHSDGRTAEALIWRLQSVFEHSLNFDNFKHLELKKLFKPGQCTVLQLSEIDEREQQVIVATILRRLIRARMDTDKRKIDEKRELYLPYPAFVLIEEAHRFAPPSGDALATGILKQILAEGRKFGVSIGLISQRPGKLDSDVLSQCMTQFIMRIINPLDQNAVASAVETVSRDLLMELPALSKGQVIIAGSSVNTPVLCKVRRRITTHGAESKDAPIQWQKYFSDVEVRRRQRENALPVTSPARNSRLLK